MAVRKKSASRSRSRAQSRARPARKNARRRKAAGARKRRTGRKSGLTQISYNVSSELEEIIGAKRMTRPMIVKKLWAYIKQNRCQDAQRRRMIVPDRKLAAVLGNRPIDMLKIATALNRHIKK